MFVPVRNRKIKESGHLLTIKDVYDSPCILVGISVRSPTDQIVGTSTLSKSICQAILSDINEVLLFICRGIDPTAWKRTELQLRNKEAVYKYKWILVLEQFLHGNWVPGPTDNSKAPFCCNGFHMMDSPSLDSGSYVSTVTSRWLGSSESFSCFPTPECKFLMCSDTP